MINYAAVALFCHAALQESSANANGGLARRRNRRSTCGTLLHATGKFDYYRYYYIPLYTYRWLSIGCSLVSCLPVIFFLVHSHVSKAIQHPGTAYFKIKKKRLQIINHHPQKKRNRRLLLVKQHRCKTYSSY